jgi:hypothetical protein
MVRNRQTSYFIAGIILMGLGGLFLFAQLLGGTFWSYFWPYLIIIAGLTFLAGMVYAGRGAGGLAIPGTIITTLGFILFFQNLLGWWQSWAYAWTVLIIATGAGLYLMGVWNYSERVKRVGANIALLGGVLLLLFGTFFGLGFSFLGFGFAARVIWPLTMIVGGALLVIRWGKVLNQPSSSNNTDNNNAQPLSEAKYEITPVESMPIAAPASHTL